MLMEKINKLRIYQNALNNRINILEKIINKFNTFEQLNNSNFENDNIFKQTISSLKNLENEIQNEINHVNNKSQNLPFSETYSEVQHKFQESSFLIQDSFYNKKDKMDETFNKLLEEEKRIIIQTFYSNQRNIMNIISKNNILNSIPNVGNNIINKIVRNEDSFNFIKKN